MNLEVCSGIETITPSAVKTAASIEVKFPPDSFTAVPQVVCHVVNSQCGTSRAASPSRLSRDGFTLWGWSTDTKALVVHWIAVN